MSPQSETKHSYVLCFRKDANPAPQTITFLHPSNDIRKVMERAKKHCELMGYRFIGVRRAVIDLDEEEKEKRGV